VNNVPVTANGTYSTYVWSDLESQRLNMGGKGRHERTLLWVNWVGTAFGVQPMLAYTLAKYQTDAQNNVPASMILNPLGWDGVGYNFAPVAEHDLMHVDFQKVFMPSSAYGSFEANGMWKHDIQVKRKLDDTDAIMFAFSSMVAGNLSFAFRTYVSW